MSKSGAAKSSPSPSIVPTAHDRQVLINAARKEAHAFRGALIDRFAHFERSLGPVLVLASTLPEYAAITKKRAHLIGQKIEQLRLIAGTEGPLKKPATGIAESLEALCRYEEARHFMAHATLEIIQAESEELLYLFCLTRARENNVEQSSIVISKAEAKSIGAALGDIVEKLTQQLDALGKTAGAKIAKRPVGTKALPA